VDWEVVRPEAQLTASLDMEGWHETFATVDD
jgi:hypothetical protein